MIFACLYFRFSPVDAMRAIGTTITNRKQTKQSIGPGWNKPASEKIIVACLGEPGRMAPV